MTYNPEIHHRHSIRLKEYDYASEGAYFVTICAFQRECLFGEIVSVGAGSKPALSKPALSMPDLSKPALSMSALSMSDQEDEPASMELNEFGRLVDFTWHDLPNHNRNICLDVFVIMPNHVHGIIVIENDRAGVERAGVERVGLERAGLEKRAGLERAGLEPAPTAVSEIIRQFKTFSSKRINKLRDNPGCPVWQRNYYERVIRDENELARAREYIVNNPLKWLLDKENPVNTN